MRATDIERLVDLETGRIDRRVVWDEDLYEMELERVFSRTWLFLAHESQLPGNGDFLVTAMGEDEVIVCRDATGELNAFLNSCPHRGNRVCHAEAGNTRRFVCNYHGWVFDLNGTVRGMHERQAFAADPCLWDGSVRMGPVPRLECYKGLVFGNFDPDAPSLAEDLGDFRWYLDVLLDNDEGGTEFLPGCIRSVMATNWKVAAENFAGDVLHAGWSHASATDAAFGASVPALYGQESYSAHVNGHCWEFNLDMVGNSASLGDKEVRRYIRARAASVADRLGRLRSQMVGSISSGNVFPNFSILPGLNSFRVWQPRGPRETELHTWILVNRNAPDEIKEAYRVGVMRTFSPSGTFEMDDGENWEYSTHMNRGHQTRRQPLYYGLGLGSEIDHPELPGTVHREQVNDANQRAFYGRWLEEMRRPVGVPRAATTNTGVHHDG